MEELFDEMEVAVRHIEDSIFESQKRLHAAWDSANKNSRLPRTQQAILESMTLLDFIVSEMHTEADEDERSGGA